MFTCAGCNSEISDRPSCCMCKSQFPCVGIFEVGYRKLGERKNTCPDCENMPEKPAPSQLDNIQSDINSIMKQLEPLKLLVEDVKTIKSEICNRQTSGSTAHDTPQQFTDTKKVLETREIIIEPRKSIIPALALEINRFGQELRDKDHSQANNIEMKGDPFRKDEYLDIAENRGKITDGPMAVNVEKVLDRMSLSEGPHWSSRQQALYFVSILDKTIHKYLPDSGVHTKTKLETTVNHIIPVEGTTDQFVVNSKLQLLVIRWDGQENSTVEVVKRLGGLDADSQGHTTINDAKADPRGRLYTGTIGRGNPLDSIPPNQAGLYKIDGGNIEKLTNDVRLSNGLAFDLKEKAFYYVDTLEYNIRRYDYDVETGNISNKKYIFDFKKNNLEGYPDGMTIDTDGNLWLAVFEGYAVLKIDPRTGNLLQKVDIPVRQVTSVTFGGPNLDVLYVTTAAMVRRAGYELEPLSGCIFAVTGLGVKGTPNLEVKL